MGFDGSYVVLPLTDDAVGEWREAFAADVDGEGVGSWELLLDLVEAADPDDGAEGFVVGGRLFPGALVVDALGPERAATLPGAGGAFLLDAAATRAAWPSVEAAFRFSPGQRADALARMAAARERGDAPTLDLEALLDLVPAAFGAAVGRGLGVAALGAVVG